MALPIQYIRGDATYPQVSGGKIIAHICNEIGLWGKGFVLALNKRWEKPLEKYLQWFHVKPVHMKLGMIQLVGVESDIFVANMIAQRGVRSRGNPHPICYESLDICLEKLALKATQLNASVHMPKIGSGLAGGKWEEVEKIIQMRLCEKNVQVYVYETREGKSNTPPFRKFSQRFL